VQVTTEAAVDAGPLVRYGEGYEAVSFDPDDVDVECFATPLSLEFAERLAAVPFRTTTDRRGRKVVHVAISDPSNLSVVDDLRLALSEMDTRLAIAPADLIAATLQRWARIEARAQEAVTVSELAGNEDEPDDVDDTSETGQMGRLVATLIDTATAARASDIHFEPQEDSLLVRFRIDGVMREQQRYPKKLAAGIINRVKVLARIDVAERRKLQDGRFAHEGDGRRLDCRVVTVPTSVGTEGAVIRLLDQGRRRLTLEELGFSMELLDRFRHLLVTVPNGTVLVTGPTGAGKTTTLYAALELIARPDRKTLAIEDPVEVTFEGITQVQVNEAAGLTFAKALRGFLRADPDVMLVGEIRDTETARLATEAALTGHLVLSTLHTNDAAGAPPRLSDLGVEPFLTASSLRAVLSQRLLRRLCVHCRSQYAPTDEEFDAAGWPSELDRPEHLYRSVGCSRCDRTGYFGRIAVGELVIVDAGLAQAITDRAPAAEVERLALASGTVPLRVEAASRVADGVTSLAELRRAGL
jgi:type IV pilus assembly protein PilB